MDPLLPRRARSFSRRELLMQALARGGALALTPSLLSLLSGDLLAQQGGLGRTGAKQGAKRRLIMLWLEGGPSQLETFDPKPGTATGGPTKAIPTDVAGWSFAHHLPKLAARAESLAVIRSMTTREGSHARARELVQSGYVPNPTVSYPSLGSIVAHELGDLGHELPAFVQIDGAPLKSGYLGVDASPFVLQKAEGRIENLAYAGGIDRERLDHRSAMVEAIDDAFAKRGGTPAVDANRAQRTRARRLMDTRLLTAFDLSQERDSTRDAYGRGNFGQGVLLARRLIEHGVQAVQVVLNGWDTHENNFGRCAELCNELDPAFAALLDDLKKRQLLADTLVVCMGEFGRTPELARGGEGRNHWPNNWCVALAGGGIKGGQAYGATDPDGRTITDRPVQIADLFATLGATLRLDGTRTFHAGMRPIQLIDPEGRVLRELLT
ncbi:MAG: DUF1501 domain-containing protein [Planctomycetes bacterium]|nr:DUF1501 domain-containing protein [Planctomycetota bacterium]